MSSDEHEGRKLKRYLGDHDVNDAEFSRACGLKSPSGVYNYFEAERIGDRAWQSVKKGLVELGLNPSYIRPEPVAMQRDKAGPTRIQPTEDLTTQIEKWPVEHLRVLYRVLQADESSQLALWGWLKARVGAPKE